MSDLFATLVLMPSPVLADSGIWGMSYFLNSNTAGKAIVLLLLGISLYTWTIMLGKYFELSRLDDANKGYEDKLMSSGSVLYSREKANALIPYSYLADEALNAYFQAANQGGGGSSGSGKSLRIGLMENALQRAISRKSGDYEEKMTFLASVVSGAPFLGLLGTVWGVMEAFGSVALQANVTLQMLAPGVSGALLTTVAALCVAIPSVFGYNILFTRTKAMVTDLENFASDLADRIELEHERYDGENLSTD